ncbi:hypothetical protein AB4259_02705 [Vibrio amylolyticus]|uniref:portal protein n=1 Tax=Vibrio amylolyticus TaxID=2847292 RepID=UPI0035502610
MSYKDNGDYLKKFSDEKLLEQLSLQARYYYDEADDGKQEKGKVYRDSYYAYKALIPNVMKDDGSSVDLSQRLPVEPVIRKATNQVLATAKNTLLSDQVHAFIYRSKKDHIHEEVAKAVTSRVNDILLRENDGDKIFTQAFKEAIITGDSFVKYFIEEEKTVRKGTFGDFDEDGEFIPSPVNLERATLQTEDGKYYQLAKALDKFSDTPSLSEQSDLKFYISAATLDAEFDGNGNAEIVVATQKSLREISNESVFDALNNKEESLEIEFEEGSLSISIDQVLVEGEVELVKVEENIVIEFVPFQDIYIDRYLQDTDITKADYLCHRIPMPRYKAHEIYEGADEEALKLLQNIDTNVDYPYSNFKMNTQNAMTDGYEQTRSAADDMLNNIFVYEHYYKFKCPETGKYELMQVTTAKHDGSGVLCVKKVKCIPFVHYSAFPMNTSFWSESIYDYLYDEQVRQTTFTRSLSTSAVNQSKNSFIASKNLDSNGKRALLSGIPNSVVFADNPNDVVTIPVHPLSQSVVEGLNISKESVKEEWSSSVGQDLIDNGSNMSATGSSLAVGQFEMKDKAICKNLAVGHTQLAMGILSLLSENQEVLSVKMSWSEQEKQQAQEAGVELQPVIEFPLEDLDIKGDFIPDVNTPNDLARQATTLVQGIQFAAQFAPETVTPHGVYEAVDKLYEAASVYNTDTYLQEPNTAPLANNQQIKEMMEQLEERNTAMAQAQYDFLVSQTNEKVVNSAGKALENRQYQIDKQNEEGWKKAELAMQSKELRSDIFNDFVSTMIDIYMAKFQVERAAAEAMLTADLGSNVKLGSYQGV